ncbi:hypothetical protein AMECASPLE_003332 [Ameca splendens]|uniref:Uncharacterized protein n=1 Tax=Ameca splendens TaxID=208324 RepID=A0ABV0Z8A2_9TELE
MNYNKGNKIQNAMLKRYRKKLTHSSHLPSSGLQVVTIVYATELWKDGGFAWLSTGIELTFGLVPKGDCRGNGGAFSCCCLSALGVVFPLLGIWLRWLALNVLL